VRMRILAVSDIHSEEEAASRIIALANSKKYDTVLILGDIIEPSTANPLGTPSFAEDLFTALISSKTKVYSVFGNSDIGVALGKSVDLHAKKIQFAEFSLAGFGGSITRCGAPWLEFSEEEFYTGISKLGIDNKTILMLHQPPFGIGGFDKISSGVSVGSKSVARIIDEKKPAVVLCGHIHEQEGVARYGETLIVKVGAAMNLRAAEIEIKDGKIEARNISL